MTQLKRNLFLGCQEFLLSEAGKPFEAAFRGLRLSSLIGHPNDVDMIQGINSTLMVLLHAFFNLNYKNFLLFRRSNYSTFFTTTRFSRTMVCYLVAH